MTTVNVYLTFNGNCEEAFNFYRSVFGGEFAMFSRFNEMPADEGNQMPEEEGNRIMHVGLPISKETMLMGSDTGGEWAANFKAGTNFSISVSTDSREKADQFFNDLAVEGQVIMPMNDTFWGDYFGMCVDQFGINWMVGYNANMAE
ncbi:VOC family protein [Croceimicrobium sp.]|uniref:VOC family protein n=1 Tax=Croceimicrobium sp. TaxID=2828340 RepID=UPI003BAC74E1